MLERIKEAIDYSDWESLYSLALEKPDKFFSVLSLRLLGKKRLMMLHAYLSACEFSEYDYRRLLLSKVAAYEDSWKKDDNLVYSYDL